MRYLALTAAALALGAAPALAATTNTPAGPSMTPSGVTGPASSENAGSNAAMQTQGTMPSPEIQQKITHELSQAGFTDIHVMPQSFLVHAKDSAGNPVYMAITPNSLTALTLNRSGTHATQPGSQANPSEGQGASSGGQAAQYSSNGSSSPMGTSSMQHSSQAGSAINSSNGNGTPVR